MPKTLRRILAYLTNDLVAAEALVSPPVGSVPAWITEAAANDKTAEYAVEVARKSHEIAEASVKSLQDKAAAHLTFLLALVPFALAGTAVALPPVQAPSIARQVSFVLLAAADVSLVVAITMTALAAGMVYGGGISLDRLGTLARSIAPSAPLKDALRAAEAEALRYATVLSYDSGVRVARDLFSGRRYTVIAVLFATAGFLLLIWLGGGIEVFRPPPPSP